MLIMIHSAMKQRYKTCVSHEHERTTVQNYTFYACRDAAIASQALTVSHDR